MEGDSKKTAEIPPQLGPSLDNNHETPMFIGYSNSPTQKIPKAKSAKKICVSDMSKSKSVKQKAIEISEKSRDFPSKKPSIFGDFPHGYGPLLYHPYQPSINHH